MKKKIIFLILLIYSLDLWNQSTYAKIIDYNGTPQYADQLVNYKGHYYMAYTQIGIDEDGELFESQGGVLKLDEYANMLDSNLIRRFSDNNNCLVIDSISEKIFLTGEEYFKTDYAHRFMMNEFKINDFKSITKSFYKYPDEDQINYYQKGSLFQDGNLLLIGSSKNQKEKDIRTLLFSIKDNIIDTSMLIDLGFNTLSWSSYIDKDKLLTLHIYNTDSLIGLNDKSIILKLDTNFQEVWRWESPKLGQQLPHGCQLSDGRSIVAMHTPGYSNIGSVWCINEDKSIAWKMEFPDKNGGQQRRILRLKQIKNGDIVGVGYYGDTRNDNPDYIQIPFIFRLSKDGTLKWLKAFYRDVKLPNDNLVYGYFSDVVEMENGDLMAVGRIDDYLEYDPIAMTERADPDILIVRTDANGCIDAECATVTKIEKTVSTIELSIQENLPYTYLFPNPGSNQLELLNHELVERLQIYSITGELVQSINEPSKTIDLARFKGTYIVNFTLKNGTTFKQKIITY